MKMHDQDNLKNHLLPAFDAEVEFFSKARTTMPENGYRPHIVLQKDPKRNYLGIFFTGFSGNESFDFPFLIQMNAMYEMVDYSAINVGDAFWVMEGANIVAEGKILDLANFCHYPFESY